MHAAYSRLARSDPVLSAAIAADIDGFIARQVKHGGGIADTSAVCGASRAYLIEELAAITLQGRAQSSARIYPARSSPASAPFATEALPVARRAGARLLRPRQSGTPQGAAPLPMRQVNILPPKISREFFIGGPAFYHMCC